ncbi:hypothetical protein MKMG_00788 [Methanogenium sp. MK-MG]|nr:hypothetical protein MKMG_00788 [Methanogenium sp. MK-MG]
MGCVGGNRLECNTIWCNAGEQKSEKCLKKIYPAYQSMLIKFFSIASPVSPLFSG